jgi:hypothetical protein
MGVFINDYLIISGGAAVIVAAYDEEEALTLAMLAIPFGDTYSIEELPKSKEPGVVRVIRKT